ncbi:signal peptidase I [Arthrobacter sp. U41]|uniref:signal peptidase I n=1 Tax=Arthrobacter sp. U41 TaxID=1849032 RepID=UPI000859328A|nr:signal peptidase I [Arthrobacter sp. U41]AOT02300.1 signal peptidase I [Arthrobacter sp. U41]
MKIGTGKQLPLWASVARNMLIALVAVSLVQGFLVKAYRIPSGSMEPTLQGSSDGGDRILVNRLAYAGSEPRTGDIVVFTRPESWQAESGVPRSGGVAGLARSFGDVTGIGPSNEQFLVKRVVASGGQTISCCGDDGKLRIDGLPLDEPYVFEDLPFAAGSLDCQGSPQSLRCVPSFTVPEGELVVLGDHRSNSVDSAIACRSLTGEAGGDCVRTVGATAVVGQVAGRFWPLNRFGGVG